MTIVNWISNPTWQTGMLLWRAAISIVTCVQPWPAWPLWQRLPNSSHGDAIQPSKDRSTTDRKKIKDLRLAEIHAEEWAEGPLWWLHTESKFCQSSSSNVQEFQYCKCFVLVYVSQLNLNHLLTQSVETNYSETPTGPMLCDVVVLM